ncbi:covalently-linked cell wall protein [Colletotrichum plurivorum]|uniref:Covalently-linked cell wall protein n=1 Tax=Colletotrichum plurivorum TaxID=2175906 RepID=A0A8H6N4X6_9PEZI|nr:covalently-linked cell wall protein [Colletotrichum plurivorum]
MYEHLSDEHALSQLTPAGFECPREETRVGQRLAAVETGHVWMTGEASAAFRALNNTRTACRMDAGSRDALSGFDPGEGMLPSSAGSQRMPRRHIIYSIPSSLTFINNSMRGTSSSDQGLISSHLELSVDPAENPDTALGVAHSAHRADHHLTLPSRASLSTLQSIIITQSRPRPRKPHEQLTPISCGCGLLLCRRGRWITVVTVIEDGQPQVVPTTVPIPICQIGDGQIQGHTTPCGELPHVAKTPGSFEWLKHLSSLSLSGVFPSNLSLSGVFPSNVFLTSLFLRPGVPNVVTQFDDCVLRRPISSFLSSLLPSNIFLARRFLSSIFLPRLFLINIFLASLFPSNISLE